jgi:hypothetical protein
MTKLAVTVARLLAPSLALLTLTRPVLAQETEPPPPSPPDEAANTDQPGPGDAEEINPPPPDEAAAPIPPYAEGAPVAYQNSGYCYVGPHPADAREGGGTWDPSEGAHVHAYPPVDLRLFTFRDGCYYFTGDPTDFGYGGEVFPYYGAHPVQDAYGGGWCFMAGGHSHAWRPWSPYFVVTGSWYYWRGAYDAFFWSYWPYYSFYYRSYYPRYYGGGRYYRGREYHTAPPIAQVPGGYARGRGASTWHAGTPQRGGQYAPAQAWRGEAARGFAPSHAAPQGGVWRGTPTGGGTFAPRPTAPAAPAFSRPAASPGFRPSYRAVPQTFRSSPAPAGHSGGSFHGGGHGRGR